MIARNWLLPCFGLFVASLHAATPLETVQPLAAEWARLRSETIRLETQWRSDRLLIESNQNVLQQRVERLRRRLDALQATHRDEEKAFNDLKARRDASLASLTNAASSVAELAKKVEALQANLPPRLQQAVALPLRSLQNEKLGAPEKMQLLVSIAGRSLEFNRLITYSEETIALPSASEERVMQILYWGLSHAYALDQGTGTAYLGRPSAGGWAWEVLPNAGPSVARLIAIHRETADPSFVAIPAVVASVPAAP